MVALSSIAPGTSYSYGAQNAVTQNSASSFIPNYSQTPILESIAQYAQQMAPQVYQWGMDQYAKNQGNINQLMQQAQTYASPERIKSEMGMAEAGVTQAGEQARQASIADLQSYGIDPSSGRYAALDQANRVQTAAAAAGAGNQQRMATQQAGLGQQYQALSSSLQNTQMGYGAANAMNQLLGTGMQLKYSPLGQTSQGTSVSSGYNQSQSSQLGATTGGAAGLLGQYTSRGITGNAGIAKGGYISPKMSPSNGEEVDDIPARLNAGEYVIPKDVVDHLGTKTLAKLIATSRKERATNGSNHQQATGYAGGGPIFRPHRDPVYEGPPREPSYFVPRSYHEWESIPAPYPRETTPYLGGIGRQMEQEAQEAARDNPEREQDTYQTLRDYTPENI